MVPARALADTRPATLLALLTALLASQPASTDIYLPALPVLGEALAATPAQMQLTLSLFIAAFALAQLVAGPMSDRFGRRPVVLFGATCVLLACTGAALSNSLSWLVAMRVLQAVGACALVVCARALVRDLYPPEEGMRVMSRVLGWMAFVPMLGPTLGGLLVDLAGWRSVFALLAVGAAVVLFAALRWLPESNLARDPTALAPTRLARNYWAVARSPVFWAFALTGSASYCTLFSFLSGSSFVVMRILGHPAWVYGIVFGVAVSGFIVGNAVMPQLLRRLGIARLLMLAASLAFAAGLAMLLLAATLPPGLVNLLPMIMITFSHGLITAGAQVGAIGPFPDKAGTAAALMGFQMHVLGALIGLWVGWSYDGTMVPLAATICATTALLTLSAFTLARRHAR